MLPFTQIFERIASAVSAALTPDTLHQAVINNDYALIDTLIAKGHDINQQNEAGQTPMHLAVIYNRIVCIHKLMNLKANLLIKDAKGHPPAYYGLWHSDAQTRSVLGPFAIEKKTVNTYYMNETMLHRVVQLKYTKLVRALIKLGADVNAPIIASQNTPLHLAVQGENPNTDIIHYLLTHKNINTSLKNNANKTAYDLAFERMTPNERRRLNPALFPKDRQLTYTFAATQMIALINAFPRVAGRFEELNTDATKEKLALLLRMLDNHGLCHVMSIINKTRTINGAYTTDILTNLDIDFHFKVFTDALIHKPINGKSTHFHPMTELEGLFATLDKLLSRLTLLIEKTEKETSPEDFFSPPNMPALTPTLLCAQAAYLADNSSGSTGKDYPYDSRSYYTMYSDSFTFDEFPNDFTMWSAWIHRMLFAAGIYDNLAHDSTPETGIDAFDRLHDLIADKNIAGAEALLARNDDPNEQNIHQQTPLHMAILSKQIFMIQLLLATNKIDLSLTDHQGKSILMTGIKTYPEAVPLLVQYGAKFNHSEVTAVNTHGKTRLHLAAQRSDLPLIQKLLDADANPATKDNAGNTAYDYAFELPPSDIREKILSLLQVRTQHSPKQGN